VAAKHTTEHPHVTASRDDYDLPMAFEVVKAAQDALFLEFLRWNELQKSVK
jgi:hypothetical protein